MAACIKEAIDSHLSLFLLLLALRFLPFPAVMLLLAALVLFVGPVWQFIKFEHRRVAGVTGIVGGPVGAEVACEHGE